MDRIGVNDKILIKNLKREKVGVGDVQRIGSN